MTRTLLPLPAVALLAAGCPTQSATDDGFEPCPAGEVCDDPTDADVDVDADSDSDSDADSDTDPIDHPIEGDLVVQVVENGVVLAEGVAEITGDDFTGDCGDCDWAFGPLSADILSETEGLYWDPALTFVADDTVDNLRLVHFPQARWDGVDHANALVSFFDIDGIDPKYTYLALAYDGMPNATFAMNGDVGFTWTYVDSYTTSTHTFNYGYYQTAEPYCEPVTKLDNSNYYNYDSVNNQFFTGDFPCGGGVGDVLTFQGVEDTAINITVDNYDAAYDGATAFDPLVWIDDREQCITVMSDDSFECAFYGAAGFPLLCPSFQFTPPESGTYTLVLTHSVLPAVMEGPPGDCVGDTAGYVLVMDAANDLRITLAEDDVVATEIVDAQHEYRVSWEAFFGE